MIKNYSGYINNIQYDNNQIKMRKFFNNSEIPFEEQRLIMMHILSKIPECVNNTYKPTLLLANAISNLGDLFTHYNDSGKHISSQAGLYPIFFGNDLGGILSMTQAKQRDGAIEMRLDLSENARQQGIGPTIINDAMYSSFVVHDYPLLKLCFTWKEKDAEMETELAKKMGIEPDGSFMDNGNKWVSGFITRQEYIKNVQTPYIASGFIEYEQRGRKQSASMTR